MSDIFQEQPVVGRGLLTVKEAARKYETPEAQIREYLRRGRIATRNAQGKKCEYVDGKECHVREAELQRFLENIRHDMEKYHSAGLNPELAFFDVPEWERTRHVHRLHPYLGKFIPQLVEFFLERYFAPGQWVLDPFMGSGTTLVQANEMGIHAVGIDVSEFNCKIADVKTRSYDLPLLKEELLSALHRLTTFSNERFGPGQAGLFPPEQLEFEVRDGYLKKWFAPRAAQEILFYRSIIPEYVHQDVLRIVLSRAARSARLVPHYDLATPSEPVTAPYYCYKHKKTCEPTGECLKFIRRYTHDTLERIEQFAQLRTESQVKIIHGDSRHVDLDVSVHGILTSPPYVGQIDYHDQHTYAYELFGIPRRDESEIGPKKAGKSKAARKQYIQDIAAVILNCKRFILPGAPMIFVANDRFDLYPEIARLAGCRIEEVQHRAVSKRTERDTRPYTESIFLMKQAH